MTAGYSVGATTRRGLLGAISLALAVLIVLAAADQASASHFRSGNLSWQREGTGTQVSFQNTQAWRRDSGFDCIPSCSGSDGNPSRGDVVDLFGEGDIAFGDGGFGSPRYLVTFANEAENYIIVRALADGSTSDFNFLHPYGSNGQFTARTQSCCTISELQNASGSSWNVSSFLNLAADSESPRSSIPPIVAVPSGGIQRFTVPVSDPGGQTLRFRLSDALESCAEECEQPQPPGLTVDPTSGVVTWDTTNRDGLWWTGVVIEALSGSTVVSSTQIQYIIRVGSTAGGSPPSWNSPTPADGSTFDVLPGQTVTFSLAASDPDSEDTVEILQNAGPGFTSPTAGNPATARYSFTPSSSQAGEEFIVQFLAQDDGSPPQAAPFRTVKIRVNDNVAPNTTITSGPSGAITSTSAAFGFSSTEAGSTFQCRLDGPGGAIGAWGACSTPKSYSNLAAGSYTFRVRAIDRAANTDPTPAARSFSVNRAPVWTAPTPANNTSFTVVPGQTLALDLRATDPDGQEVEIRKTTSGPSGLVAVDGNPATARYTFTPSDANVGSSWTLRFNATDTGSPVASAPTRTYTLTVAPLPPSAPLPDPNPPRDETPQPPAPELKLDLAGSGTDLVRDTHSVQATLTSADQAAAKPVEGAQLRWSVAGVNPGTGAVTTAADGTSAIAWRGTRVGEDVLTAFVDTNGSGTIDAGEPQATHTVTWLDPPTILKEANVEPVSGKVFVKLPPGASPARYRLGPAQAKGFIPLTEAAQIPLGSTLDTSRGRVEVQSAVGITKPGQVQSGQFYSGHFQIRQTGGGRRPVTEMVLNESLKCQSSKKRGRVVAAAKRSRRLWGSGKGRFRTRGRNSSATVRGTEWLTKDTCTTTTTLVKSGTVTVRDFGKRKNVTVRKGKKYVARAKRR